MMNKKLVLGLMAALLCLMLLAGCRGAPAETPPAAVAATAQTPAEAPAQSTPAPQPAAPETEEPQGEGEASAPEDDGIPLKGTADAAGFIVEELGDSASFHTELQQQVLAAGYEHTGEYTNNGTEELSIPAGITLRWSYTKEPQPDTFTVKLGTKADLSDATSLTAEGGRAVCSCTVQNLMLGTTYCYSISAGGDASDVHSFTTSAKGPRNLFVEGVTNVRDIGGWATLDGGYVRQGLVYRCAQLNTEESTTPCITEAGVETMLNVLGVKTEIDFRRTEDNEYGGITESPLGASVSYHSLPISYVTDVSGDLESIKAAFRLMEDEGNYPLFYHCKIGTDRTGLFTYLLLGLLNVSMEDIYTDYTFSNLGLIVGRRDYNRLDKMLKDNMEAHIGATPNETARSYLRSLGFTDAELNKIVGIMVER